MADLGLSCAEFAEDFGHGAGFDAAGQKGIELFGAGGYGDEFGAALVHFCGGGKAHGDEFRCYKGAGRVSVWLGMGEGEGRLTFGEDFCSFLF